MVGNFQEKVQEIKKQISPEKKLYIQRLPPKIKTRFMELAMEEFENDYGMLLKKLVEVYDGFYPKGNEEIETKINILTDEVVALKQEMFELKQEKQEKGIKSVSGKLIRKGGD